MRAGVIVGALWMAGCASLAPDYDPVTGVAEVPADYARGAFLEARAAADAGRPADIRDWWMRFDDPVLNVLVERGLAANRDITVAVADINAARANLGLARSEYFPTDAQDLSYQRIGTSNTNDFDVPDQSILDAAIGTVWEIDLFGRIAREVEIAGVELASDAATLSDVRALVAADIADTFLLYRGLQAQADVVAANIETLERTRDLTIIIRDAGRGTDLDVERANEQLATTRATLPPIRADLDAARYSLGLLTALTPPEIVAVIDGEAELSLIDGPVRTGNVGDLIRRRPDLRAAELDLLAANATIGLRKSEAYPVIGLAAGFGLSSSDVDDFVKSDAINFNLGPSLSFSAVEFIRADERVAIATEGARAALAQYERAVFAALAEIETALSAQSELQAQMVELREARRAATEAARLARIRFEAGASDFLTVLDAEGRAIDADNALAQTRTATARAQVAVFRALRAGPA